ncbi:MAG: helix-turn-helix domain-containing protein [Thiolinea sp.]
MEYTHMGKRIRNARENKGLTQAELAAQLGVKRSSIERWENETSTPRVNKLSTMSGLLDVPLLWLLAGAENVPETSAHHLAPQTLIKEKLVLAEQGLLELNALLGEIRVLVENLPEAE